MDPLAHEAVALALAQLLKAGRKRNSKTLRRSVPKGPAPTLRVVTLEVSFGEWAGVRRIQFATQAL